MINGETLRVILNQVSLDDMLSLIEKLPYGKSHTILCRYTIHKIARLFKRMDKKGLFADLLENYVPDYSFVFCIKRKENKCVLRKTSVLVGLIRAVNFIIEDRRLNYAESAVKYGPIIVKIYEETSSQNYLLYMKVLEKLGMIVSSHCLYKIGRILGFKIPAMYKCNRHLEQILIRYPKNDLEMFIRYYKKLVKKDLTDRDISTLKYYFQKIQELKSELKIYNISSLSRRIDKYIKSVKNWDEEFIQIFGK